MHKKWGAPLALFLVLIIASVASAQLPTGTILGTVKDSSGGVVPQAKVTILSTESSFTREITTGDDGAFRVPALPVGHYTVKFEKEGFQTEAENSLTLEVGQELVVNGTLQVGASTQEVTVTGEAPVVNTTNGSLGSLVNEEKIADLPLNGRNWVDLTLLQPGIEQHTNLAGNSPAAVAGTFFSSNGATIRSNNYMLDGAPMVVIYGGTQASINSTTLGVDGIREYKVVTNNFSADYGLFMGSQTTLVSKGGTNQFHGSGFEYIRNSALDAANFFDNAQTSGTTLAGAPRRLPPFKRNNFGASFGGPIQKDKTFFFATYEGIRERKGLTENFVTLGDGTHGTLDCRLLTANPCATSSGGAVAAVIQPFLATTGSLAVFPAPNEPITCPLPPCAAAVGGNFAYGFDRIADENYGQFRLDHTFSDRDTAFARYTIDKTNVIQPAPTPNPIEADHPASAAQFTTVSETHIFTTNILETARFSISRSPLENGNTTPEYPCSSVTTGCSYVPGFPQFGIGSLSIGSGIQAFSPGLVVHHDQKIYAWSDDIFYTKGRNGFKFGFLETNWKQRMELQNSLRGSLSFANVANFLDSDYTSYSSTTPGAQIQRNWTSGTLGFYAQDDFRATSRLTLNAGLRYEFLAPNYHEVNGLGAALRNVLTDQNTTPGPVIQNPSLKDFTPRLGFAWDVFGDGKTSLRGGAALLYDVGNLGAALIQAAGATPVGPIANNVGSSISTVTNPTTNVIPTGPLALTIPFTYPSGVLGNTLNLVQYNLSNPHIYTGNLTIERQLPFGIGLSVGFVGTRGVDIMNRKEANPCQPEGYVNATTSEWSNPTPIVVGGVTVQKANTSCPKYDTATDAPTLGRVNPNWASITYQCSCSASWYNSLQVQLTKQLSKGFQFQASYTYSSNLDEGSGQQSADNSTASIDPQFPQADYGPAAFDVKHNLRINAIYHLPKFTDQRLLGAVANGWWLSSIISWQTGYPFTPSLSTNRSDSGVLGSGADRPNLAPGRSIASITSGFSTANGVDPCPTAGEALGTPQLWFDPCAFTLQAPGYLGDVSRDLLRGPNLSNVNFSMVKDTPLKYLGEAGQLEFRAEIFNIFNHPNFILPAATVYTGSTTTNIGTPTSPLYEETPIANPGGQITSTGLNSSRQIQFALRVSF